MVCNLVIIIVTLQIAAIGFQDKPNKLTVCVNLLPHSAADFKISHKAYVSS